jgi:hypothetical protein
VADDRKLKCTVRDGRFVQPCGALDDMIENNIPGFSNAKGIAQWNLTNLKTHEPSRSYIGIKSKKMPKGLLFNFCPWCGEKIDAPFADKPEAEVSA